jgi:hypothetical protein
MCFYTCISKNKHCQNFGYFGQYLSIQLDSQPSHQTGKLKTAAFPAQPATASPNKQALKQLPAVLSMLTSILKYGR